MRPVTTIATHQSSTKVMYTALHPNNTQRQNVKLALKVFDEKNVAALTDFATRFGCDVSGTQNFILTVVQLWKILNVKHPQKGRQLNDEMCEPIRSLHDGKLQWLSMFFDWLCSWEQLQLQPRHGCLSKETMCALKHTVICAKLLAEYLLRVVSKKHAMQFNFAANQRAITSSVALQRCLNVL